LTAVLLAVILTSTQIKEERRNMRKLVATALLAGGLLVGCGTPGPVTLVEKEYEPAGFKAGTSDTKTCEKKDKSGKCLKWKTKKGKPAKFEAECWELEWSNGDEECVTKEQFDSVQVGQVRP
jgi:predicted small lipoprotein YifL